MNRLSRLLIAVLAPLPLLSFGEEDANLVKARSLVAEAQGHHAQGRYTEALTILNQAQRLFPGLAPIYNVRGAIYLSKPVRDLRRAKDNFEHAQRMFPREFAPRFNLAEVAYVGHDWVAAEKAFTALMPAVPKGDAAIEHLVLFKVLVSLVKQQRFDHAKLVWEQFEATQTTQPAYFYSRAVVDYEKGDRKSAGEYLAKAAEAFSAKVNAPYEDCLMEADYVRPGS